MPGHACAGDWVELRADDDVLLVLATAPHPLDPSLTWAPADLRLTVGAAVPPGDQDPSRTSSPECARALDAVLRSSL